MGSTSCGFQSLRATNANWMSQLCPRLWDVPLHHLSIPGHHSCRNIFADMLCPRGEVPTLRQLWACGRQVVLSYEAPDPVSRHPELWPAVPYWWGDKVKTGELIRYLETMKSGGRPDGLFVAGINLTENLGYVLAHPSQSLETMTLPGLPCLGAWVREQCPGPSARCTNIIAGDFIGADSFVSDVIRLNDKLLAC
ncbi:PI-PLC X domain-containing protein 1 [Echinops telfairi]|uniref:PI-PLC X domain-containing protein 1 n=1 Tax=Echinops telfairi TaxID=9371 RepID=A0AC55D4U7_ECHTE|nr:PI-PLC X domain-containing protein 1 [Echinops telfairi]